MGVIWGDDGYAGKPQWRWCIGLEAITEAELKKEMTQ